ncbi:MAG: hypothetical protein ISS17_08275 [Bacteroidales bacterium]|nr:hypothetical protein [Bacteroidales bacterium]
MVKKIREVLFGIKPGIPKRHLLLIATAVWLFAGGFLLYRGIRMLPESSYLWLKLSLSLVIGLLFFHILFLRVSFRHIVRIRSLEILRPCIFSFFDWKSYLLMTVMIASGILVRKSGWFSLEWVALFYITMATPLLLSAVRFFRAWRKYSELVFS